MAGAMARDWSNRRGSCRISFDSVDGFRGTRSSGRRRSRADMVGPKAAPFMPPALPWRQPQRLAVAPELKPGLDPHRCGVALGRLCAEPDVRAVEAGCRECGRKKGASAPMDEGHHLSQPSGGRRHALL
jgi:hypothetical protein